MSVALTRTNNDGIKFSNIAWAKILSLAKYCGWVPAGTIDPYWINEPDAPDWGGGYNTNDGQRVLPEDALNIAKALERALEMIAGLLENRLKDLSMNEEFVAHFKKRLYQANLVAYLQDFPIDEEFAALAAVIQATAKYLGVEFDPTDIFLRESDLREFIEFCRKGEFYIY